MLVSSFSPTPSRNQARQDAALGNVKGSACKLEARATWHGCKRAGRRQPAQPMERDCCGRVPAEGASLESIRPFKASRLGGRIQVAGFPADNAGMPAC
jgi:hypothetical protein